MTMPHDWNMVVSVREGGYQEALQRLRELGTVSDTEYFNVLVLRVDDVHQALDRLREWYETDPQLRSWLGRAVPVTDTFTFHSPLEFRVKARDVVMEWLAELAGKGFHVRMHRRGFKRRLSSHEEEKRLGAAIIEALDKMGTPAYLNFDDPDVIVAIETVGQHAGLSIWTREMLAHYPFLHLN